MKRRCSVMGACLLVLAFSLPALAQTDEPGEGKQDDKAGDEGTPTPTPDAAPSDDSLKTKASDMAPTTPVLTTGYRPSPLEQQRAWKDIVVIPRKPFMKSGRVELFPYFGVTMNDNLIQHWTIGGEVNYFLTDILAIGVLGQYYFSNVLDEEFKVRYHFGRIPSLNKYRYTVALNFSYVPIYGKFALFNKHILHLEVYLTAGVGGSGTEIIPRDYNNEIFTNPFTLTFPVGAGVRFFVLDWLAVHAVFRDFMMLDKYEPSPRGISAQEAKDNADTRFINNMMFTLGVSFWLPPHFKYTTFR
jgi:outer membrane beta-barrel protein